MYHLLANDPPGSSDDVTKSTIMNKIIDQILGYAGKLNQIILVPKVTGNLDGFDSRNGVRFYFVRVFQFLSLFALALMLYLTVRSFMDYWKGDHTSMEKVASVITLLICLYAAFPLSQVIRSRGESLDQEHSGMPGFLLNDFVKMTIRLVGELAALSLFFSACCNTIALIFKSSAFVHIDAAGFLSAMTELSAALTAAVAGLAHSLLSFFHVNVDFSGFLSVSSVNIDGTTWAPVWSSGNLLDLLMNFVSVIMALVTMYITLAAYHYVYAMGAALLKWLSSPTLPVSVRNRS